MPQYDDSFLFDCEKKRNARSYKPCNKFAINVSNIVRQPHQDNGTIGKWKKKYFTLNRNASPTPSSMPIYRSMCSLNNDNSTFNCKFKYKTTYGQPYHTIYIVLLDIINPRFLFNFSSSSSFDIAWVCSCSSAFYARMHRLILFIFLLFFSFRKHKLVLIGIRY